MPLFNKYTPLSEGELKAALETYIHAQHFKMRGLFTMDGSRRSTHQQRLFHRLWPLSPDRAVRHADREAHGAGTAHGGGARNGALQETPCAVQHRHDHRHQWTDLLATAVVSVQRRAGGGIPNGRVSPYAGLVFFGFLFTAGFGFVGIFASVVSRRFEYQADAYAVTTTGQPEPMITALKKLNVDNYGHLTRIRSWCSCATVIRRCWNASARSGGWRRHDG